MTQSILSAAAALLLCMLLSACGGAVTTGGPEDRIIISNVNVLTMQQPEVLRDQVVIVQADAIVAVRDRSQLKPRQGDRTIDAAGGFLIPGLIDAHVHIDHAQDLKMASLFGVTSAVNMRGLPWHLRLRDDIRSGEIFSPDFLTSGDYLDGDPPDMLPMASVAGTAAARGAVDRMHDTGYDFIKVYSQLSRDQYLSVCEQARARGIRVAGHLPDAATLDDVTHCPHVNVAHGEQLFKVLQSRQDSGEIRRLVQALSKAGMTFTANTALHLEGAKMPFDLEQLVDRPEAHLIHPATFQPFRPGINRYARRDDAWSSRVTKVAEDVMTIRRTAAQIDPGVLVAGSDMPVAGAYPGASLINEILSYQQSGLSAYQALMTATVNAARLLQNLDSEYPTVGMVTPGARADLVLLASNPLEDLSVLRSPAAVMLRGRWYDQSELEGIRAQLAQANADVTTRVKTLESHVFAGELATAHELFTQYRMANPGEILFAQYPFFFFGFSLLYGESGLTDDPQQARKAVLLYDMYQQTYPEIHSAHHVHGLALQAAGDLAGARKAQQRALTLWPGYPPAVAALERLEPEIEF